MERAAASAFPRASHPADQEPTTHAEVETGHRARTWNYSLNITFGLILQSCSSLTTCDLASHIDLQHSRSGEGAIVGPRPRRRVRLVAKAIAKGRRGRKVKAIARRWHRRARDWGVVLIADRLHCRGRLRAAADHPQGADAARRPRRAATRQTGAVLARRPWRHQDAQPPVHPAVDSPQVFRLRYAASFSACGTRTVTRYRSRVLCSLETIGEASP